MNLVNDLGRIHPSARWMIMWQHWERQRQLQQTLQRVWLVVANSTTNNRTNTPPVAVHASGVQMNSVSEKKSWGSVLKTRLMMPKNVPGW